MSKTKSSSNKKQEKKKTKTASNERKEVEDSNNDGEQLRVDSNKRVGGNGNEQPKERKRRGISTSYHDRTQVLVKEQMEIKDSMMNSSGGENSKNGKKEARKRKKSDGQSSGSISGPISAAHLQNESAEFETGEIFPKKKRKKKKKTHRKKKHGQEHDVNLQEYNEQEDSINAENELEGSMISTNVFVLIDRKAGKVYSSTELLPNGERKQVGKLDDNGRVILLQEEFEEGNSQLTTPTTTTTARRGIHKKEENANVKDDPSISSFPFKTDSDDHCESPLVAYEDICPLLESYKRLIRKKSNRELSIYDPYYCDGRVALHLKSLGFPEVYNKKEDCYEVWKDPSHYPEYDVFLTNPPYSGVHVEKLMQHVSSCNKPWMLLMPNFVHKKDYFQRLTVNNGQCPIYLVPKKRYIYQPPPNFREKKVSDTHKKSSPFISMWYIWGGSKEMTDKWFQLLRNQKSSTYDVARSKSGLRDLRRKK